MRRYLADVIEVAQRLNGRNAPQFHRELQAVLNPTGGTKLPASGIIAPGFYEQEFGIPFRPRLTDEQEAKLKEFGFRVLFFPSIGEADYPESFVKLAWGKYLDIAQIARHPLSGQFAAIETIAKPNYDDPAGYPNDRLGQVIGLQTRFKVSDDDLRGDNGIHAKIAKELGFPTERVRSPYAEEHNWAGNLFNYLREKHGEPLPDLGATNSWEWCENSYGSDARLLAGGREYGGLSAVDGFWHDARSDRVAFRVLVVL